MYKINIILIIKPEKNSEKTTEEGLIELGIRVCQFEKDGRQAKKRDYTKSQRYMVFSRSEKLNMVGVRM